MVAQSSLPTWKHARFKKAQGHRDGPRLPDFFSLPPYLDKLIIPEVIDGDNHLDSHFYPVENHAVEHDQQIENNFKFDLHDPENPETKTTRKSVSVPQNGSRKKDELTVNNEYVEKGSLESKESKLISKKAQSKVRNDLLKQRDEHHRSMMLNGNENTWMEEDFFDSNKREYGDATKYDASLQHFEHQRRKSMEETWTKMLYIVPDEHDECPGDEHEDVYTMCIQRQSSVDESSAFSKVHQSQKTTSRNSEEIQLSCSSDATEMMDSKEKDEEKATDEKPSIGILEALKLQLALMMNYRNIEDVRQMKDSANEEIKKSEVLIVDAMEKDVGDTEKQELGKDLQKAKMDDINSYPKDQVIMAEDIACDVKNDAEGQKLKSVLDDTKTKELTEVSKAGSEEENSDVKMDADVPELKQKAGSHTQLNQEPPKINKRNRSMKKQRPEIFIASTESKHAEDAGGPVKQKARKPHQRSPKKSRDGLTKIEQEYQAILKDVSEPSLTGYAEAPNKPLKKLLDRKTEQNRPEGSLSLLAGHHGDGQRSSHNSVSDKQGIHKPAKRRRRGVFHYQKKRNMKWFRGNWKRSTIIRKLANPGIPPRWLNLAKEKFHTWSYTHGQNGDSGGGSSYGSHGDDSPGKSPNQDKGESPGGNHNGDGDTNESHDRHEDGGDDGQEARRPNQEEGASANVVPNDFKQFKKKHHLHGNLSPEEIVCGLGKLSCEPIQLHRDENWFAKMLTCLVTCLCDLQVTVTECDTCSILQSLLNHSGNCFAPLNQCSECRQVFVLIGYHLTICIYQPPNGADSCSALCREMRMALVEEYPPETVAVPFSRIQRYLRILMVSDARDIMEAFSTIDDLRPPTQSASDQPKRPLVRKPSAPKSYRPRLLSIVETLESGDKLTNIEGIIRAEPIGEENIPEEPTAEELLYRYGNQANQAPEGDVKGPPENTTRIYGRSGPASLPIGSRRTIDPSAQMLSFSDRPVGTPGIGEVVYGCRSQLLVVIRHWSDIKTELKRRHRRPRETREEGVILSKNLKIVGTRYQEDAQFIITTRLGAGMSGTCHHAQDYNTNFEFCIKKLSLRKYEESELEIWSGLNHEHIVKLYGATRFGNTVYIYQEFIGGGSLMHCIHAQRELNQRLSTATALSYLKQILEALVYLKENGILHEDLKPDNVLLRSHDQVRTNGSVSLIAIADFGLSAHVSRYHRSPGKPVGGSTSWSPEKAASEGHSFPAEVWAVICILVNILSGHPPWIREFADAPVLHYIIKENSPPVRDIPSNIHSDVRGVILQGWTVDPRQRPTAAELLKHPAFDIIRNSFMDQNYSLLSGLTSHQRVEPNEHARLLEKNMSSLEDVIQSSRTQATDQSEELVGATCMDWNRTSATNTPGLMSGEYANHTDDWTYRDESSRDGQGFQEPLFQGRRNPEGSDIPCHDSQEEKFFRDDQLTMLADIRQQESYVLQPYDENDYERVTPAHRSLIPNLAIFNSSRKMSFESSFNTRDTMSMEKDATATSEKLYDLGIGSDNHIDSSELFDSGGEIAKRHASGYDIRQGHNARDPDTRIQRHPNPSDDPHQVRTEARRNPSPPSNLLDPKGDFNFPSNTSDDLPPDMLPFITPKSEDGHHQLQLNVTAMPPDEGNVPHTHPESSQEKTPPFQRFFSERHTSSTKTQFSGMDSQSTIDELLHEMQQDQLSTSTGTTYGFQEFFHSMEEEVEEKMTEEEITKASLTYAQNLVLKSPSAAENGTVVTFCDESYKELFKVRVTGQKDWHDLLHDSAGHKLLSLSYKCVRLILDNGEEVELQELVGPISRSIRVVEVTQCQGHNLIVMV